VILLALDTATPATVAGVLLADGRVVEARDDPPEGSRGEHASRLLPLAERALQQAGVGWGELDRIAVGVGPGGFTGLRIGIATARALAQARDLPLVPVSSLAALAAGAQDARAASAHGAPDAGALHAEGAANAEGAAGVANAASAANAADAEGAANAADAEGATSAANAGAPFVAAVIDARRGEVFAAAYEGDRERLAPSAFAPEALAARLGALAAPVQAVGDGAVRFRQELEAAGVAVPADGSAVHRIAAAPLCRLGAAGEPAQRDRLLPDYRREPDAKPQ
jgi:tRNA threonylcarbamoyladenosine biosynthesis protein TsaB